MDIREKLVELIGCAPFNPIADVFTTINDRFTPAFIELIADHLLANGVTIQEWIPVTERLPKIHTNVLVYRPKMATKIMVSYFGYDRFCDGAMDIWGNKVITHWMPLPQPPKGE